MGFAIFKKREERGSTYWYELLLAALPYLGLLLVALFFTIVTKGQLLSGYNIKIVFEQSFFYMIGALGMSLLFAQGGIDLSFGSTMGVAGIIGCYAGQINAWLTVPTIMGVCLVIGGVNAFLYAKSGIMVFVQTLSMSFLLRGLLAPLMNNKANLPMSRDIMAVDGTLFKVIVLVVMFAVMYYLMEYTLLGKHSKAIGAGQAATVQAGVNVPKTKALAFIVSAVGAGVLTTLLLMRSGSAGVSTGTMFEFNIMIAMTLGGMPTGGGAKSKLSAAIIGSLVITILTNGMVLWGLNARLQDVVKGLVFVIVIVLRMRLEERVKRMV